jgi:hypothetical protein
VRIIVSRRGNRTVQREMDRCNVDRCNVDGCDVDGCDVHDLEVAF